MCFNSPYLANLCGQIVFCGSFEAGMLCPVFPQLPCVPTRCRHSAGVCPDWAHLVQMELSAISFRQTSSLWLGKQKKMRTDLDLIVSIHHPTPNPNHHTTTGKATTHHHNHNYNTTIHHKTTAPPLILPKAGFRSCQSTRFRGSEVTRYIGLPDYLDDLTNRLPCRVMKGWSFVHFQVCLEML